jgi:hypothetical protein
MLPAMIVVTKLVAFRAIIETSLLRTFRTAAGVASRKSTGLQMAMVLA